MRDSRSQKEGDLGGSGRRKNIKTNIQKEQLLIPTRYSQTKAKDFEGVGGPEDKIEAAQTERGGDQDVIGNTRQGGETVRP